MYYTYLLQSKKDKSFYTGITKHPKLRLKRHNNGCLKTTSFKRPWKIVFVREHSNYQEARKHEKWLKKKNREYKNKLAQLAPPISGGVK